MSLPPFPEMIPPILRFGADNNGMVDGKELRLRLPDLMQLDENDITERYESGVATKFEMYLRHAIKVAGDQGLLKEPW